ncbi:MAG: hypothetical protein P4L81_06200 [Candidatus Pacebacteria bacterium]|nr:hypothetical protein [Candidatus Paceibacterota bacterium]
MKVAINHTEGSEKTGIFSKPKTYYLASFDVQLSAEELAIIRERGLEDAVLLTWENPNDKFIPEIHVTVALLIKNRGFGRRCPTPAEAKRFDAQGREALKNLKAALEENATIGQSDSFEL